MASLKVVEIMTSFNERSTIGRVVINPPKRMAPLKTHNIGQIRICCGRAFLSDESYYRHRVERKSAHLKDLWNDLLIEEEKLEENAKPQPHSSKKSVSLGKHKLGSSNKVSKSSKSGNQKKRARKGDAINCGLCGNLTSKANYWRHLRVLHNKSNKVKCKWCTCTFPSKQLALRHGCRLHPTEYKQFCFKAAAQNKHVVSARAMSTIVKEMSQTEPIAKITPKSCNNEQELSARKKTKKGHECVFCGKVLSNKITFKNHLLIHSGDKPYKCKYCQPDCHFRYTANLYRHYQRKHPAELKFKCAVCPFKAVTQGTVTEHTRKMHKEIPNEEPVSPNDSKPNDNSTKSSRKRKKRLSIKEILAMKPIKLQNGYECGICKKILSTKHTYRGHLLIHANVFPVKCEKCGVNFRLREHLTKHLLTNHVENGLYSCAHCSCKFNKVPSLSRHMQHYHSGTRKTGNSGSVKIKKAKAQMEVKISVPRQRSISPDISTLGTSPEARRIHKTLLERKEKMQTSKLPPKRPKVAKKSIKPISNKIGKQKSPETQKIVKGTDRTRKILQNNIDSEKLEETSQVLEQSETKIVNMPRKIKIVKKNTGTRKWARSSENSLSEAIILKGTDRTRKILQNTLEKEKMEQPIDELQPEPKIVKQPGKNRKRLPQNMETNAANQNNFEEMLLKPQLITSKTKISRKSITKVGSERKNVPNRKRSLKRAKLEKTHEKNNFSSSKEETFNSLNPNRIVLKLSPSAGKSPRRIILKISKKRLLEGQQHLQSQSKIKILSVKRQINEKMEPNFNASDQQQPQSISQIRPVENVGKDVLDEKVVVSELKNKRRGRSVKTPDLQCKICFKTFASPQCKRLHETLHTGSMQYSCDFCNQEFRLFSTFNFHIKRFENPTGNYFCALCIARCGSEEALTHHMAIHKYKKKNYNKNKC